MTAFTRNLTQTLAVAAAAALLAACGSSSGVDGTREKTGFLKLGITDAPVDYADEVVVQFSGVELKPTAGPAFSIDFAPRRYNLLAYDGTDRAILLDGVEIPAGEYEWLRLKVDADAHFGGDSYVRIATPGDACEMRIPSGAETGLKIIRGFTVAVGALTDFTIDFDLSKSLVAPPGQSMPGGSCAGQVYMLKPVLRMVNNMQVGSISGSVHPNLITAQCVPAGEPPYPGKVYLFGPITADNAGLPEDNDDTDPDPNGAPVATARVSDSTFTYTIGFVAPGTYRVAYTCDLDDPALDASAPAAEETVVFTPSDVPTVTVTASAVADADFGPPAP